MQELSVWIAARPNEMQQALGGELRCTYAEDHRVKASTPN